MLDPATKPSLIAVDIGNSRIKLGEFSAQRADDRSLPEPTAIFELPIIHDKGALDVDRLSAWGESRLSPDTQWAIASVHRGATELLMATLAEWAMRANVDWPIRWLTFRDVPLEIRVEQPARVGIDRLLGAVAANRLRQANRAAIIADLGTAITVDLLTADGAFAGGAILPGIGMSARALHEQTDALPCVAMEKLEMPPAPLGESTEAAIESGLYWGAVGAIERLITQLSAELPHVPDILVTGGASQQIAQRITVQGRIRHVPHLVLAGIALVAKEK